MAQAYVTLDLPDGPEEKFTGLLHGLFGHFLTPVFYGVLLAIYGVTVFNAIAFFLLTAVVGLAYTLWAERTYPNTELPGLTPWEWFNGIWMLIWKGFAVGGGWVAFGWWALSHIPVHSTLSNSWWLIILATVLCDLSYYWIHRMLSHGRGGHPIIKYYRKKHAAHHSVTEMDFMRGNQSSLVDTAIAQFQPAMFIIAWLLGMDLASTLVAYGMILALQATDHTNITFQIGWLRHIFMDNHAHKLHHCKRGNLINHAAAFSIFDRLWGTYYEDWRICGNYLHHNRIALPIKRATPPRSRQVKTGVGGPAEQAA